MLAFGYLLLIVCLYIGMHMALCGCVLMCMWCMLYYCALDIIAVMQLAAPIGWQLSILWDHQCYNLCGYSTQNNSIVPKKQRKGCGIWLSRCTNSVPIKDPSLQLYITSYNQ